jgi:O-methyltransferase
MRHLEIRRRSLVGPEALWTLQTLATQCCNVPGDFIEAGVYRGGTAKFLRNILDKAPAKTLRLFDTFSGMPTTDSNADFHKQGDFADTNLEDVKAWIGADRVSYHPGFIPETFAGLEDERFAFAHVDVDIRQSVLDCCVFIYPRMIKGGVMVFDDYGLPTCPGARMAVDEFFAGKPEQPLALSSGQAVIFKICDIN